MKYYIIAGEASGDLHGSNLIKGLKAEDARAEIRFWGGDLMAAAGGTLVHHYREGAVMGITDVLAKAGKLIENLNFCKEDISVWSPDVVILIDYPGFNMRLRSSATGSASRCSTISRRRPGLAARTATASSGSGLTRCS